MAGIREFEESAFCKQYKCKQETVAEMRGNGSAQESSALGWDYEYRIQGNNLVLLRMRLSSQGERQWPLFEIRWSPLRDKVVQKDNAQIRTHEVHKGDFAFVPDLVGEIVGPKIPRAGAVYDCAKIMCRVCPDMSAPCGTFAGKFDVSAFLTDYLRSIYEGHNPTAFASISDLELRPTFVTVTNKDGSQYLELSLVIAKAAAANPGQSGSVHGSV